MKAHIVGGGFGGLAAAALLIRNAGVPGADITIYEADELLGGGFFLGGSAASGYNLPGSVFDKEFRCTFELLKSIPSARNPAISATEDFFAFNLGEPYQDRAHIFDRNGRIVHGPRFGLSLGDGLSLARISLTPEAMLYGRRIEEFFSAKFFSVCRKRTRKIRKIKPEHADPCSGRWEKILVEKWHFMGRCCGQTAVSLAGPC